ncbi:MAG: quinol monooxygenase YgiN [Gammaproteobacteria bacterium]|jgi:quinol monooxygenase YgiN
MACQVLLEVEIVDGCEDQLKAKFVELLPDTRSFKGCIYIYLNQDLDDPSKIIIVELWESREHYDQYLQWRTDRGDMEVLGSLMKNPSWRFLENWGV